MKGARAAKASGYSLGKTQGKSPVQKMKAGSRRTARRVYSLALGLDVPPGNPSPPQSGGAAKRLGPSSAPGAGGGRAVPGGPDGHTVSGCLRSWIPGLHPPAAAAAPQSQPGGWEGSVPERFSTEKPLSY